MLVIKARNVHRMLPEALRQLSVHGEERDSRNGPVVVFRGPVTLEYQYPKERVMFWWKRDANPFFHFFESLWMLGGCNDVKFLSRFTSNIANYSDDGKTFHGAYGHRWRQHFKFDQLGSIIAELKRDKDNRRCYLQMWDAECDLGEEGKDFPCNVGATFHITSNGLLDMVVHNRSNDLIWGACGANAVHFSYLQEYIATCVGVNVGRYWQVSSNMHAYKDTLKKVERLADEAEDTYRTTTGDFYDDFSSYPLMSTDPVTWQQDLGIFLSEGPIVGFRDSFFRRVATPMWMAHKAYKSQYHEDKYAAAIEICEQIKADDWKLACVEWLYRRRERNK